jgi:hypothetical protein
MESEEEGLTGRANVSDLYIQYGDIISLQSPSNRELHQHTFFVDYVSETKIRFVDVTSLEPTTLYLTDTGHFRDESIDLVELLSRANETGYARQAGLVPHTWIKVEFGGEYPMLIVGEITALDEDQIEITTFPMREVVYIDFAYQGLPEELNIEGLDTVEAPVGAKEGAKIGEAGEPIDIDDVGVDEGAAWEETHDPELEMERADPSVRDTLHKMYLDANDIVFDLGEDDVVVGQVVEISEHEKIYSVDSQINDMLDELLSTIPDAQRSPAVMDRVHRLLARFRELRSQFSRTDEDTGRVLGPRLRTALASDKPLVPYLQTMDPRISNLAWLVPVVTCRRKLYDVAESVAENVTDAELLNFYEDISEMQMLQKNYDANRDLGNTNHDRYMHLQSRMSDYLCPFVPPSTSTSAVSNQLDTVIENDVSDDTGRVISTVVRGNDGAIQSTRFVAQRFQSSETMLRPVYIRGEKIFKRMPVSPNETAQIRSWIAFNSAWMEFSRVRLPNTNILCRTGGTAQWPMRFRRLHAGKDPEIMVIESGTGAVAAGVAEDTLIQGRGDKHFVFEDGENGGGEDDDVGAMIPDTIHLMENLQTQSSTSLSALMTQLEPFLVYTNDLTYTQYKYAQHLVRNHIRRLKQRIQDGKQQCDLWRNHRFTRTYDHHSEQGLIKSMLPEFMDHAKQVYGPESGKGTGTGTEIISSSESWSSIVHTDGGVFLAMLTRAMLIKLQIPISFVEGTAIRGVDDMDALEQIKPTDCARRFLAKKYTSLGELQQDNHEGIFYDKEMDDTPYGLLKSYASEKQSMTRDAFEAYLAENLVQKHACPRNQSLELAHTLIDGKKPVRDGEYAVLSISPTLKSSKLDPVQGLSQGLSQDVEMVSSEYTTKHTYYKRTRGVWIKDDTTSGLNENSFVDSNTLFCNIRSSCTKQSTNGLCTDSASARRPYTSSIELRKELAERYARTAEEVEKTLEDDINLQLQRATHMTRLRNIQHTRYNLYYWSLGKHAQDAAGIVSPAAAIRDQMLGESDFVVRQHHIVAFVDNYARTPMIETLGEDAHWMYCIDTNTRLLPAFLYELARAFTTGGSAALNAAMDRVIQHQGVVSDDGDAIVDKYSGYTIRKIDYVMEDEFDDVTGMRIQTHGALATTDAQEDAAAAIAALVRQGGTTRAVRVFENATSEDIYRIFRTMCYQNMGIESSEALEDFVLRAASNLANAHIRSEASYDAASRKMEKDKGKKLMPYAAYRRQTLTILVGAVALVGIQTTVPPFRVHKTFPGCVQSFHGFPLAGIEDLSSIVYVSCVLSSQDPSLKRKILEEKLRNTLIESVLPLPEVQERYQTRHEYDQKYGIQRILPELHSLARWRTFLPALVTVHADALGKTLHSVSKSQVDHLLDLMRTGHHDQQAICASLAGKMMRYGYGIAAGIHAVVAERSEADGAVLQTESHVAFLQNACCAQEDQTMSCLTYFETANTDLRMYRQVVEKLGTILDNVRETSTPPLLFDTRDTRMHISNTPLDHTYSIASTYAAFIHYGNFDRPEVPIPDDLEGVIPDKPTAATGYPMHGTLDEKIEALKKMGKRYHVDQLNQLLQIVFRRQQTQTHIDTKPETSTIGTMISQMVDLLDHLDTSGSTAIEAPLRNHLLSVLAQYTVGTMVHEDSEETRALKNYLQSSNTRMRTEIVDFMRRSYGDAGSNEFDQWTTHTTTSSTPENMMHTTQFIRNSVYQMCQVFSSRITHGVFSTYTVPDHWKISEEHVGDMTDIVEKYTHRLKPFVQDTTIDRVFESLDSPLRDLIHILQYIPIQSPIQREQVSYHGLFDVKTTLLLHWHIWYSVYYLYMQSAKDPELVRIDITERRNQTRQSIRDERAPMQLRAADINVAESTTESIVNETLWEADDSAQEMQIKMSTQGELQRRVAELIWTYFTLDRDLHNITNRSYSDIISTIQSFSKAEKKTKTDYFKNMNAEERMVEFQMKNNRLGIWSIGTLKDIVKYNPQTYEREKSEKNQNIQLLEITTSLDVVRDRRSQQLTTDSTEGAYSSLGELDQYDHIQANLESRQEAYGIEQFGEDYTDGDYYGEDDADE